MDYDSFKQSVLETFKRYLPEEYQDYKVTTKPVHKVNQILDNLMLVNENNRENTSSPSLYINLLYEEYKNSKDFDEVMVSAANSMIEAFQMAGNIKLPEILHSNGNNIIFCLINSEQNGEMLCDVPHREFLDLSVIYRMVVETKEAGISSFVISHNISKQLGFTEEDLYRLAMNNTKRILPVKVSHMRDVLMEIIGNHNDEDDLFKENADFPMMYVLTNTLGLNGAAILLYNDEIDTLATKLESDLHILPSSIHEVIAIKAGSMDITSLSEMVTSINLGEVSLADRLSNQVYHYDKTLKKLSLASNNQRKIND